MSLLDWLTKRKKPLSLNAATNTNIPNISPRASHSMYSTIACSNVSMPNPIMRTAPAMTAAVRWTFPVIIRNSTVANMPIAKPYSMAKASHPQANLYI